MMEEERMDEGAREELVVLLPDQIDENVDTRPYRASVPSYCSKDLGRERTKRKRDLRVVCT